MSKEIGLWLCLFLVSNVLWGQEWKLQKEASCPGIDQYIIDNQGNLLVALNNGELRKYNRQGEFLLRYSPVQQSKIHEINSVTQFKTVLFYKDLQEYVLLNRYLGAPITYILGTNGVGYVEDIGLNLQQNVWLIDMSDFSLKLIDATRGDVIERKSLAKVLDQNEVEITYFHSHQNRLYLVDRNKSILIFDTIGNFLTQWDFDKIDNVGFFMDNLYYRSGSDLVIRPLYGGEERVIPLPSVDYKKIAFSGERLIGFSEEGFHIYHYLSETK
jgi:hypothetical protein